MTDTVVRAMLFEEAEELAHIGSWVTRGLDVDAQIAASREARRIFGIAEGSAFAHKEFLALIHPDDLDIVKGLRIQAIATRSTCDGEFRLRRADDGRLRWLHSRCRAIIEDGVIVGTMGVIRDVTDERRVVDELRTSEERYRRIVETTNEGIWIIDQHDRTTFANKRMATMLGLTPPEMNGRTPFEFMDPVAGDRARRFLARHKKAPAGPLELHFRRHDGTTVAVLVESTPIFDEDGDYQGALAMVIDVTARARAEARFARLAEAGIIGIATTTNDDKFIDVNDAYARLVGYEPSELRGTEARLLVPPEWHKVVQSAQTEIERNGKTSPFEMELVRKDGTRISVIVGVSLVDHVRLVFIVDVSAHKAAIEALKRSEEQLREAQKMEAIGRLAGGVAHDFNNLLSVILSYTSLILDTLNEADPLRADLEEVQKAGERAAMLTRQLLAFSRRQVLRPRAIDLNETIAGMQGMLARLVGEDVQLVLSLASNVGRVHADPNQVEQVVMNLVVNARDAMIQGGTLTLETSSAANFVRLRVIDTGCGMDAATMQRIFEPFFTTKEKDKGTGLGLSTVLGIVEQSGGRIEVKSEVGQGSTFDVFLPWSELEAAAQKPKAPNATARSGTETILLVEDEDHVRTLASAILRRNGYHVLEAQNAGEAILLCEEQKHRIGLLLTDVVMPRVSGPRVAKRLREMKPDLKVLYMSGYSDELIRTHLCMKESDGDFPLLHKPLRPDTLLAKVRETLDG